MPKIRVLENDGLEFLVNDGLEIAGNDGLGTPVANGLKSVPPLLMNNEDVGNALNWGFAAVVIRRESRMTILAEFMVAAVLAVDSILTTVLR